MATPVPTLLMTPSPVATPSPPAPIEPLQAIEVVDRPARHIRALTDGTRKYRLAAWAPNGPWIAVTPQDGPGMDLIHTTTGNVTIVVTDTYVLEPDWTPDGKLLVLRTGAQGDSLTLFDPGHGFDAEPLVQGGLLSAPSAGKAVVAFTQDHDLVVCARICRRGLETQLGGGALVTALGANDTMLSWVPATENLEDVQTLVAPLGSPQAARPLALVGEGLWLPRWSPDGLHVVMTSIEGRLVTASVDGAQRQDLGPGDSPAWAPDGLRIAYAGASAGLDYTTRDIHVVRSDGVGQRLRLTRADEAQFYVSPTWSPDGNELGFVELDSGKLFVGDVP